MENFKKIILRLLHPHSVVILLLAVISAVGLIFIFIKGMENTPAAYVFYLVSAYALATVVVLIPPLVKKCRSGILKNKYTSKYFGDKILRIRISLYTGTVINLVYAAFKLCIGIFYQSFWFGAVAIYYMLLCVIRYLLINNDNYTRKLKDQERSLNLQWKSYRNSGLLLLLLNLAMTAMVVQMVWQNKSYSYPGYVIYVTAGYTFYRLIMAIVRNIKMKKSDNPVYSAAKTVDLIIALMSIFALQTAMFSAFGADTSEAVRRLMNAITGTTVCFLVLCMAIFMVVYSSITIAGLNRESKN